MSKKKVKTVNSIGWIVVLAVIVLLYATYFLIYIPQQQSRVQERGFRILEEYAENIHKKKDYYQSHLENYSAFYALKSQVNIYQYSKSYRRSKSVKEVLGVIESLDNRISIDSIKTLKETDPISFYDKNNNQNINFNLLNKHYKTRFYKAIDSVRYKIYIPNRHLLKDFNVIRIPVTALMENLRFDQLYENIAFLDSAGVIHNSNGSVVNDITSFKVLQDTINKTQGGVIQTMNIRGVKNHVLILPISFLDQSFYLAGFIPDQSFKKKTRTINNQLLTNLSGIILLLLIGMPVLKIIFINRKERLNVRDAHNSTISFIIGISLLILLFIGVLKYYVIDRSKATNRIENISKKLTENVDSSFNELFKLGNNVISGKNSSGTLNFIHNSLIGDKQEKYVKLPDNLNNQFPFNEILLMNSEGKAIKAVTKTTFSNSDTLDLSKRNYFKFISDEGKSWPWKDTNIKSFEAFYIESIKSYNTGFKETALSFRLNKEDSLKFKAPYFAITSHIPALYDQILPEDVAFVVINKEGEVLFHSDQSKNLQENFLVESNHHPRLHGAIKYRTRETAQITYNERHWLARIVPIENKPLYHVTLIDMKYTDNINTRIYLFTFYFLLLTFGCIVLGMQIFQHMGGERKFMKTKTWSFKWLVFREDRYWEYVLLLFIQSVIVSCQIVGLLVVTSPFEMLVYQIIFIACAGFASYIILNKKHSFSTYLSLLVVIGILLLLLLWINCPYWFIGILALIIITGFWAIFLVPNELGKTQVKSQVKIMYFSYMFIWLMGLSAIPVIGYYLSITSQEEILSKRNSMIYMAHSNLQLYNKYGDQNHKRWNDSINGGDIENLTITYLDNIEEKEVSSDSDKKGGKYFNPDSLYFLLPSPLTRDDYYMSLINNSNANGEWFFDTNDTNSLSYTITDASGGISIKPNIPVISKERKGNNDNGLSKRKKAIGLLLFSLPLILLSIIVWNTFRFLSDIVLGTIVAKWKTPKSPSWKSLINHKEITRIILLAFDGKHYLEELQDIYKSKNPHFHPTVITADDLFDKKTKVVKLFTPLDQTVWVKGLGTYLLKFEKSELILSRLNELDEYAKGKLIFEIPYDSDYIAEYFEDYIVEYEVENEIEIQIQSYISGLRHIFKSYHRFTGTVDKQTIINNFEELYPNTNYSEESEEQILAKAHLMKLQYSHIWNNLSRMEKMILFDLADDGMLNFKNRFLINRLQMKGLLELDPYPRIFTSSFQYFLKYSINQEETTLLENKLSKQGKWKNTRYMILLILIPLAGFVFISQGTSIEKVIGIFTGVLALLSGGMRLMDSSLFKTTAK